MSTTLTIEQMNVELSRFEGRKFYGKYTIDFYGPNTYNEWPEMKYHSSWDWLMPVWKKAGEFIFQIRGDLTDQKYLEAHRITKSFMEACQKVEIERAHEAVFNAIQFIQWYNKQKEVTNDKNT